MSDIDFEILDARYVKKDDCVDHRAESSREIEEIRRDSAVLKTKLNITIGILSAIAVPVLAIAVKLLFKG